MKFSHLADCHIGSWRDPKMSGLSTDAFIKAMDKSIEEDVDFILISGDLFNTALPGIERLKMVVVKLKELLDLDMPVYIIAGSHDFSPSGKTMLDVLESAGLLKNVVKGKVKDDKLCLDFTVDSKTKAKIAGMLGKRGMLEKHYYEDLDLETLENKDGFKIFMLHTALTELKSKELEKMDSSPLSVLPKGFDYYAAGHVHEIIEEDIEGYGKIIYPGPLFPNNFKELEKLRCGGFYIYDNGSVRYEKINLYDVESVRIDCNGMSPEDVFADLRDRLQDIDVEEKIITLRLYGTLSSGKVSDINLGDIIRDLYESGAYFVMKNTSSLSTSDFEEIKIKEENIDMVEERLISEHMSQAGMEGLDDVSIVRMTRELMQSFSSDEEEGERKMDFHERVKQEAEKTLSGFVER